MKFMLLLFTCAIAASSLAQSPPAAFPGASSPAAGKLPLGPAVQPKAAQAGAKGIVLKAGWDRRITGPAREQNHDMADLRAILQNYGEPKDDLEPHPDALVFPGIPYLTPLKKAEQTLAAQFGSFGLASEFTIATEGFPQGLKFRKYDRGSAKIDGNLYVYILIDGASQVISIAFVGRGAPPFVPKPFPPFIPIPGQRYRDNLIDKSDGGSQAAVADARSQGKYIVAYTTAKRNTTWYVPQPVINLILYCSKLKIDQ